MDVFEVIKNRRSIRAFKIDRIPEKVIDRLVDALIWAPSAGNLQARKFCFVFNEGIKKALAEASLNQDFICEAPLVIVGCADLEKISLYGKRGKNLYSICDVSASIENLLLLAESEGLGTCWVGAFDEGEVAKILNLTDNLRPIVIVPVGYPNEKSFPQKRNGEAVKEYR